MRARSGSMPRRALGALSLALCPILDIGFRQIESLEGGTERVLHIAPFNGFMTGKVGADELAAGFGGQGRSGVRSNIGFLVWKGGTGRAGEARPAGGGELFRCHREGLRVGLGFRVRIGRDPDRGREPARTSDPPLRDQDGLGFLGCSRNSKGGFRSLRFKNGLFDPATIYVVEIAVGSRFKPVRHNGLEGTAKLVRLFDTVAAVSEFGLDRVDFVGTR